MVSCPNRGTSEKWKLGLENGTSAVTSEEENLLISLVPATSTFALMTPPWAGSMLSTPFPFLSVGEQFMIWGMVRERGKVNLSGERYG